MIVTNVRIREKTLTRLTISLSTYRFQVGDQILRVNGYPVEDAVHQEVALLAKNQQVLVLKIRSNYLVSILIIFAAKYIMLRT